MAAFQMLELQLHSWWMPSVASDALQLVPDDVIEAECILDNKPLAPPHYYKGKVPCIGALHRPQDACEANDEPEG